MNYTVAEIADGRAKIVWPDDSWTYVELSTDMTAEDFDDLVHRMIPPHLQSGNGAPSFLSTGDRVAAEAPPEETESSFEDWEITRMAEYGSAEKQIEYIVENGLDAWVTRVAEIKAANPKT